ncbi:wwox [Scenedesmus sp. PABB004]|nr:wwox [Scenedesmus sp. PABB004]
MFGALDLADMRGRKLGTSGIAAYGRAKVPGGLSLLLFTLELQRRLRLAGAPVEAFAVHPGLVNTRLFSKVNFRFPFAVWSWAASLVMGQSAAQGAQSLVVAATSPQLRGKGGSYIGPSYALNAFHGRVRRPVNPAARDPDTWAALWDKTLELVQEVTGAPLPSLPAVGARV